LRPALSWLPDWRDKLAYVEATKNHKPADWAWEFIRRDDKYIAMSEGLIYDLAPSEHPPTVADISGTVVKRLPSGELQIKHTNPLMERFDPIIGMFNRQYGLLCFPPRCSESKPILKFEVRALTIAQETQFKKSAIILRGMSNLLENGYLDPIMLKKAQTALSKTKTSVSSAIKDNDKYTDYLRILDALRYKASDSEIADIILGYKSKKDTARKQIQRAKQVQSEKSMLLAML
jgi:hypothetical protein